MRINRIDILKGRVLSNDEKEFAEQYFQKENDRGRKILVPFLSIIEIVCILILFGQIISVCENGVHELTNIIIIIALALFIIFLFICIRRTLNGKTEVDWLKMGMCIVFDCICEKATITSDMYRNDLFLECKLKLLDGTLLNGSYFIALKNINTELKKYSYKEYKNHPEIMPGRELLLFYNPKTKHAELFDKAAIKAKRIQINNAI